MHDDPRYKTSQWRAMVADILSRDGYRCVMCGKKAKDVDHIVEVRDGGEFFDRANLRSLCRSHHVKKTIEQRMLRAHDADTCNSCQSGMVFDRMTGTHILEQTLW